VVCMHVFTKKGNKYQFIPYLESITQALYSDYFALDSRECVENIFIYLYYDVLQSTGRHAIPLQFDIGAKFLEIRPVQSPKCISHGYYTWRDVFQNKRA
jgi:hypothetical protein